jgi:hypothetical protein
MKTQACDPIQPLLLLVGSMQITLLPHVLQEMRPQVLVQLARWRFTPRTNFLRKPGKPANFACLRPVYAELAFSSGG